MYITIRVIPRSSKNEILPQPDGSYKIRLTVPPVDGAANKKIIELLSDYFDVAKSKIVIVRGESSRNKTFSITQS
jgi:uncharacterized protein (TIGR00251 family)